MGIKYVQKYVANMFTGWRQLRLNSTGVRCLNHFVSPVSITMIKAMVQTMVQAMVQKFFFGMLMVVSGVTVANNEGLFKTFSTAIPNTSPTVLIVGDSLSAGYGLSAKQTWAYLLQQKLNEQGFDRFRVVNSAVSGATTAAGLQLMPAALQQHRPSIVILALGANDGLQGKPIPYITQNLTQLIMQSQKANAEVLLLGMRIPPNFGARYAEPFFAQYGLLANQFGVRYIPFFLEGVAGNRALMQADGLHPNAEAQPILLETLWGVLSQMLKVDSV